MALVLAAAGAAGNQAVLCTCERTGEGVGTSLRVGLAPELEAAHGIAAYAQYTAPARACDVRILVTVGGVQLARTSLPLTFRLQRVEQLKEMPGRFLDPIQKGLDTEAGKGVEITFGLQFH